MKKIFYLIVSVLLLSSCSKVDKMLLEWKYRNEYRILVNKEKIKNHTSSIKVVPNPEKTITTPENLTSSTQVDYSSIPTTTMNREDKETIEKDKNQKTIDNLSDTQEKVSILKQGRKNYLYQKHQKTEKERKTSGLAIAGFVMSLVGLFVAGIILGTLAFIFGVISVSKTGPNKPKKGQGFAIAAIIIGLVAVIGALIVLSSLHK